MEETPKKDITAKDNPVPSGDETGKKNINEVLVDIDLSKRAKDAPTKLIFGEEGTDMDEFVIQKTETTARREEEKAKSTTIEPEVKRTVESELAKLGQEEKYVEQYSVEDFDDLAELIVLAFDQIMQWGLWKYSLADVHYSSTTPYKIPEERLKRMIKVLSKILMKANVKSPLWVKLLIIGVFTYLVPMTRAHSLRQENLKKREEAEKKEKEKELLKKETVVKVPQVTKQNVTLHVPKEQKKQYVPPVERRTIIVPETTKNTGNDSNSNQQAKEEAPVIKESVKQNPVVKETPKEEQSNKSEDKTIVVPERGNKTRPVITPRSGTKRGRQGGNFK